MFKKLPVPVYIKKIIQCYPSNIYLEIHHEIDCAGSSNFIFHSEMNFGIVANRMYGPIIATILSISVNQRVTPPPLPPGIYY